MRSARIGIRELREDLSRIIRQVRKGKVVEVTDHGHPVARLVPIAAASALSELVGEGTVRPPRIAAALPASLELPARMSGEKAIDLLRGP